VIKSTDLSNERKKRLDISVVMWQFANEKLNAENQQKELK